MAQEKRQVSENEESPVHQARERLAVAMKRVEAATSARIRLAEENASQASANNAGEASAEEAEKWQNACRLLEEQNQQLKEENERLNGELHQASTHIKQMKDATQKAEAKLAKVMGEVEKMLEA